MSTTMHARYAAEVQSKVSRKKSCAELQERSNPAADYVVTFDHLIEIKASVRCGVDPGKDE
jgi:hypothetical protein